MQEPTFGDWLKQRRRTLDLTKHALADCVGCSPATIAKIEANLRRPSQQIALRLAEALAIPSTEHAAFVRLSRGVHETRAVLPTTVPGIPTPLTPLIGRESELETITMQLEAGTTRLLTLSGPPGVGKTRLAVAVAQRAAHSFANGAAFVALGTVRDPAELLTAIAQTLHIVPQANALASQQLVSALSTRRMLLVLDNFEQVVTAAPSVTELLVYCPLLTVLVTSRERLSVRGEQHIRVAPLGLPDLLHPLDVAYITNSPAVKLFVETAQAACAGFHLHEENALAVATICTAVDGLPLAIELLAARADTLAPTALLARMDNIRHAGPILRDLPLRQQTLRATIDWSYNLLLAHEQRLFRCLSVFSGAWSLAAAEAVCDSDTVFDTLAALVNKSLVQPVAQSGDEAQFVLLETMRVYALEQLNHSGEACEIHTRHATWYRALAAQAAPHLKNGEQLAWIERLRAAHFNMVAALEWLLAQGDYEHAGLFCRDLRRFWWIAGYWREGRTWIERVLAHAAELTPLTEANMHVASGALAAAQGDLAQAAAAFETALLLAQQYEDRELIGIAVHNLGSVVLAQGDHKRARTLFEAGLTIDRESGDPWGLAITLGSLGELACDTNDYDAARTYYTESLDIFRRQQDHGSVAIALNNLGEVMRCQGKISAASALFTEGLALARRHELRRALCTLLNNTSLISIAQSEMKQARDVLRETLTMLHDGGSAQDTATSLFVGGLLALEDEQSTHAALLLSAAQALRVSHGITLPPHDQAEFNAAIARTQVTLNQEVFDIAWAAGQHLSESAGIVALGDLVR